MLRFFEFLPSLISALVIFFVGLYLAGFISRLVRRGMLRRESNSQAILLVTKILYWSVVLLTLIASLQQVGFNVTAFLTGLGIVGFTIGFALQDISKNFISGLILLIQQPFNVGNSVEIAGIEGKVLAVDLRATELRTFDGRIVLIPNADILTKAITNYSRSTQRRIELQIGVGYEIDLEQVRQTALDAIHSVPGVLTEPAPQVYYQGFGTASIDMRMFYWVDATQLDLNKAKDAGLCAIKDAFQRQGIQVPSPVQVLQIKNP